VRFLSTKLFGVEIKCLRFLDTTVNSNQYLVTPVCQALDTIMFATLSEGTTASCTFFANTTCMAPITDPIVTPFMPSQLLIQPGIGSLYVLTTENNNYNVYNNID
jgi:hypothetical protein